MAQVIHWQDEVDQAGVVRLAALAIERGELVALPTGVAVSAVMPDAVARLRPLRPDGEALTLLLPSPDQASEWVPTLSAPLRRLAQRVWPGPLILRCPGGWQDGLAAQLDPAVRGQLCAGGELALTVPDVPAVWYIIALAPCPVLLAPGGGAEWGDAVALDIRDVEAMPTSTVIRAAGDGWEVLQEGALTRADLDATTRCRVLFVCTGNTCRSPMAAALFRKLLAERLGCPVEELGQRGYEVGSAGIAALPGEPAAPEAIAAVRDLGADLASHASQPLTPALARQADYLITMTRGHQGAIFTRFDPAVPPLTLCPQGGDVADPIGAGPEVYRHCAQEILGHLQHWIAELERPCA